MTRFSEIIELAAENTGGTDKLERSLVRSRSLSPAEIAAIPDS